LVANVGVIAAAAPRVAVVGVVLVNAVAEAVRCQPRAFPVASSTVYVSSPTVGSDSSWSAPDIVAAHPTAGGAVRVRVPELRVSVPVIVQAVPAGFAPVQSAASAVPPVNRTEVPIPPVSSTEATKSGVRRFLVVRIKFLMSVNPPSRA
jgi:hypothetical protein